MSGDLVFQCTVLCASGIFCNMGSETGNETDGAGEVLFWVSRPFSLGMYRSYGIINRLG